MQVKTNEGADTVPAEVRDAALQKLNEDDKPSLDLPDDDLLAAAIEAADAEVKAEIEQPPVKGKGKKGAQKPKEAAKKPAAEPKKPRVTYYANSLRDVLLDRLNGKTDVLSLVEGDRATPELVKETEQAIHEAVKKGMAKKVGQKAIMLFEYLAVGGELNEVIARTFKVLNRDGHLTSGDKGNLQQDLLSKPYSVGTARSQANQMFTMLPSLKVVVKDGKGKWIPNASSTIYQRFKSA